jgi:hypothetical protein
MDRYVWIAPWLLAGALLGCSRNNMVEPGPAPSAATSAPAPPGVVGTAPGAAEIKPDDVPRVTPAEARPKVQAGQALLVCVYPDEEKYQRNKLEGSISLRQFEQKVPSLASDQEIIFYCA